MPISSPVDGGRSQYITVFVSPSGTVSAVTVGCGFWRLETISPEL
jgi:hypothetical protein